MDKPLVNIYDSVGLGIIIEFPTGVMISNQTGGTACLHPKMEGIYLPLANDYTDAGKEFLSPEIELTEYFTGSKYNGSGATGGIDLADAERINSIIRKYRLNNLIEIDLNRLSESHEAWIRIQVQEEKDFELLKEFKNYPLNGILTWGNSD